MPAKAGNRVLYAQIQRGRGIRQLVHQLAGLVDIADRIGDLDHENARARIPATVCPGSAAERQRGWPILRRCCEARSNQTQAPIGKAARVDFE
jgi:hypothetical protein